jgi:hypothetical protein
MRNVPDDVKKSARNIEKKIDNNDYNIFYRRGKKSEQPIVFWHGSQEIISMSYKERILM